MLFRNSTHRDIWIDRWCHTCFEPHEAARRLNSEKTMCPILGSALASEEQNKPRKPPQWDRSNNRNATMEQSIRCNSYQPRPPMHKREKRFEDVPMFDVPDDDVYLVPIEGIPNIKVGKGKGEVDHA
jgi:hypothetical protein